MANKGRRESQEYKGIQVHLGLAGKDGENGRDAVATVPDRVLKRINKNAKNIKQNREYIKQVNDNVKQNAMDIGGITGNIITHANQISANKGSIITLEKRMKVGRDRTDNIQIQASAVYQKGSEAAFVVKNLEGRVINVEKVLKIEVK
jgi:hypothetical protein